MFLLLITPYIFQGFTLEFMFAPNEYFSNNVLTKTYYLKFELDKEDPFSYEGPVINKSKVS